MPHLPVDSPPNLHTCLLNQHLQLLNCCMARKKRRHLAGGTGKAELLAGEEGVGRLGVLGPVAHLKLLESGETLCAPVSQVAGSHPRPQALLHLTPLAPPHACEFCRAGGSGRSDSDGGVDRGGGGPDSAHREVRGQREAGSSRGSPLTAHTPSVAQHGGGLFPPLLGHASLQGLCLYLPPPPSTLNPEP